MNLRSARWYEYGGAAIVLVSRLLTMPRTFWESDELLFAGAIERFDPWSSRPHPPGYPLYVGLGKLFAMFTGSPFVALTAISVIACVVGYVALARLFARLLDDEVLGTCAALIFYFSPAMLVHGTLPLSDSPAVACLALTLLAATHFPAAATPRTSVALGLAASATIGIRPQLVIVVLPLFVALLVWTRNRRNITAGLIGFGVLSIAWFAPLMDAAGGWDKLMLWESRQAAYVAQHDAAASRGASSAGGLLARFLAHPWGPKWIALPLFAIAALGIVVAARKRNRAFLPVAFVTIAQLIFAVAVMDPADAARYSLPHMIGIALLAGAGLAIVRDTIEMRSAPLIATALLAIASFAYTAPLLRTRRAEPSPPVAAARLIESTYPPNTVVLYDLSMRPFAEVLLPKFKSAPVEPGLQAYYDQPATPLVLIGDGGTRDPDAKTFAWPESDAYGKLTRNHYRVVTVDPVTPQERYEPVNGVYALERDAQGNEWRWLAPQATIRLPHAHRRKLSITMTLSHDAPYESNRVDMFVNDQPAGAVNVTRNPSTATVELPADTNVELRFAAHESFSPAEVLHNQDPRTLAVQLVAVGQVP